MDETREALEFDVLFVGGGPANLAGAIHLMNMARKAGREIEICLIEKAESIGSHSLSGAILDPIALQELIPDFLEKGCPIEQPECRDEFYYLTSTGKFRLPYTPSYMHNSGCYIISLSKYCTWLGEMAEELGVALPIVEMTLIHYRRLMEAGFGDEDISALFREKQALFEKSGRTPRKP